MRATRFCLFATALVGGTLAAIPALRADTCAGQPIEARGEPSRFLWLAKTKTRANWRRKVRAKPGLGADYANWARAQTTDERCYSGPSGHLCIFTGTPCKP